MPEVGFIDIGRGSLAYRSEFDVEDPSVRGKNALLTLAAFLGVKFTAKAGKWGAELWEKTGGKAIKDIKSGLFGKGTRNASKAARTIEKETLKDGSASVTKTLRQEGISGKATEGSEVEKASQDTVRLAKEGEKVGVEAITKGGEKFATKEAEKVGSELLVKEGEKAALKLTGGKIPLLCLAVGGYFAWDRFSKGDWAGGLGELASAGTAMIPGVGTVASLAIDASLAGYDVAKAGGGAKAALPAQSSPVNPFRAPGLGQNGGGNGFSSVPPTPQPATVPSQANQTYPTAAGAAAPGAIPAVASPKPQAPATSSEEKTSQPQNIIKSLAPEPATLETKAMYRGPTAGVYEVDPAKTWDLQQTCEDTTNRLQTLGKDRFKNTQRETFQALLTMLRSVQPSTNLRTYLPTSLSKADRGGIQTARAAVKEREAIARFKGALNVAPLSEQFRRAIRSAERKKALEIPQLE